MRLHSPQSRLILKTENRKGPGRAGGGEAGMKLSRQRSRNHNQGDAHCRHHSPFSLLCSVVVLHCFLFSRQGFLVSPSCPELHLPLLSARIKSMSHLAWSN